MKKDNLPTNSELLECAVTTAKKSGNHALQNVEHRTDAIQITKHDIKLKLDVECQKIAEDTILSRFPDHSVLGEEDTGRKTGIDDPENTFEWIVDPIDGTVNYSHGLPLWCCSVAVRRDGKTLAGAVYVPENDELFSASVDSPALLNGKPISVSTTKTLADSMIMTGTNKNPANGSIPFAVFTQIARSAQKARICGSAAMDICSVACGRADGYFEGSIYLWDIAAAGLIVERAGGQIEVLDKYKEPHRMSFLATNGNIHEELKATVLQAHQ